MRTLGTSTLLSLLICSATQLSANESSAVLDRMDSKEENFRGWDKSWRLDFQGLLVNNRKVVGQTEGTSITIGGSSLFNLDYFHDHHEWTNQFKFELQYTRDPSLAKFIKSLDELGLESFYLYHFDSPDWVGPYASFDFKTSVLKSKDVQTSSSDYIISERDGSTSTVTGSSLKLTRAFAPLEFKESVGVYLRPHQKEYFSPIFLFGATARETFANNQRAVTDDGSTAEIEVSELRNIYQFGTEAKAAVKGVLHKEQLHYYGSASAFTPWLNNKASSDDRSNLKLTRIDLKAGLAYHFADWIKASYDFRGLKDPQLISGFQISHDMKLIIGFDIFKSKRKAKDA